MHRQSHTLMCRATHQPWSYPACSGDISGSARLGPGDQQGVSALPVPLPGPCLTPQGPNFCTKLPCPWSHFHGQHWIPSPIYRDLAAATQPLLQTLPIHEEPLGKTNVQPATSTASLGAARHGPALPLLICPLKAHQPLPLHPVIAVSVVDIGVAFLGEVIEEDGGVEVLAAHLHKLQGPLAGHVGLQGAAGLQEAVNLAKQATRPLQPTGRVSGKAWSSGLLWGHSHGRRHVRVPVGTAVSLLVSAWALQTAWFQKPHCPGGETEALRGDGHAAALGREPGLCMTNPATSVGQPELVAPLDMAGCATLQHHSCPGCLKDSQGVGSESVPALVIMTPELSCPSLAEGVNGALQTCG